MNVKRTLQGIPEPTLRRLPVYHAYLKKHLEKNLDTVSGTQLAEELGWQSVQIRKDLSFTGIVGKPKVGYDIKELITHIEDALGWNNVTDAILVGVGNLGSALLGFRGFQACGLNIVMAFDTDPKKHQLLINGKKIFPLGKLPNLVKRLNVQIGILTVPEEASQAAADLMVASGIRAIWSFSPNKLHVPKEVIVLHENLAASLAVLSKQLVAAQLQAKP
jgi:redox-sensing transcriptional repressor